MDETKTYKWNVSHEWMNEWMDGWMDEIIGGNGQNFIGWESKVPTYLPTYLLVYLEKESLLTVQLGMYTKKVLEFSDSLV